MKRQYILAAVIGVMLICGMILTGCGPIEEPKPKPDAPADVSATAVSPVSIKVSWSRVSDPDWEYPVTGYNVYRSQDAGDPYNKIYTTSYSSDYTDTGLSTNTTYYYKVSAYNDNGEGARSPAVSATTNHLDIPTKIGASAESLTSITVSWNSISGATGYKVYRSLSADSPQLITTIPSSSTTSYTDTRLVANTTYYYTVSAYNANEESGLSSVISVKLAVPDAMVVASITDDFSITLGWYAVSDAQNYKVYRSQTEDGTYTLLATVLPSTASTMKDTDNGQTIVMYTDRPSLQNTYYYTVSASNKVGEGPKSEPVTKTATLSNFVSGSTGSIDSESGYNWHYLGHRPDPGAITSVSGSYYINLNNDTGIVAAESYDASLNLESKITGNGSYYLCRYNQSKYVYVKVYYAGQTGSYSIGVTFVRSGF